MFLETIKVLEGRVVALDYHQKRLDATRSDHDLSGKLSLFDFLSEVDLPQTGKYRLRISYSETVTEFEILPYTKKDIRHLSLLDKTTHFYQYKYLDRSIFAKDLETLPAYFEPIYVIKGQVTDTSFSALVFENREGLFAPSDCLLPSTKIAALYDAGAIKKMPIRVADLGQFDRVHLVNAMLDLGELCLSPSIIGRQ